ncbi:MAG: hypothetical protein ABIR32_09210, partial [Ilumatobacteraceae bacterium]
MNEHPNPRRRKRLSRLLRPALAVLVTAPGLAVSAVVVADTGTAFAATDWVNILPATEARA